MESEDFYACVSIGGLETCNEDTPSSDAFEDMEDISPNWEFSRQVDAAPGSTDVIIEIRDEDGFLRLGDDHVDVTSNAGRNLGITVTFVACAVSGELSGACDTTLITSGASDEKAELRIRVEVGATPSAANLNLRCTHSPLWPQAGQTVTVTGTALSGSLARKHRRQDRAVDQRQGDAGPDPELGFGQFDDRRTVHRRIVVLLRVPHLRRRGGGVERLACRAGGGAVRRARGARGQHRPAGQPHRHRLHPGHGQLHRSVRFAVSERRDGDDRHAYLSEPAFLKRQDHLNFWIALDEGDAQDDCDSEPPDNWDDDYTFADAGAITHRDGSIRDCAPGGDRIFSGDATRLDGGLLGRVFLHETGHRPFGLSDEYPPDGGYFMAEPFPNLYGPEIGSIFETVCQADVVNIQPFDILLGFPPRQASACRLVQTDDGDFWTSDPMINHLMEDNLTVQGADLRQLEYLFGQCRLAGC